MCAWAGTHPASCAVFSTSTTSPSTVGWIEDALSPLAASRPDLDLHRLAVAIRSATGIEAFVWLVDVAGLPREEAAAMLRWSARAMLRSALSDGFPPP
jgi:hypothetical protein